MEDVLVNEKAKSAVLVSSKPGCFIAGADITWLDSAKNKDEVCDAKVIFSFLLFGHPFPWKAATDIK